MLLIKIGLAHCYEYTCQININRLANYGFILILLMINMSVIGILIIIIYSCGINIVTLSLQTVVREVVIGIIILVLHAIGASIIMFIVLIHMFRGMVNISYSYLINVWYSGIVILLCLLILLYIGYVLVWGCMSYWGIVVISGMFTVIPLFMEILCGNYICCINTCDRFIVFHVLILLVVSVYIVIHMFFMHCYIL